MHKLRKRGEIDVVAKLERQLAAANKRAEEAEKDADRYRWLRDYGDTGLTAFVKQWKCSSNDCDEMIDEAMKND